MSHPSEAEGLSGDRTRRIGPANWAGKKGKAMEQQKTWEERRAERLAESTAAFVINTENRRAKFIERLRLLAHQEELAGKHPRILTDAVVEELIGLAY